MFGRKKLLERIDALEAQVRRLENMHANFAEYNSWEAPGYIKLSQSWLGKVGWYYGRQLEKEELERLPFHPQPLRVDYNRLTNVPRVTADTVRVKDVSLEELARLVIDHTPIQREEEVKAKRVSKYTEDTTTTITVPE